MTGSSKIKLGRSSDRSLSETSAIADLGPEKISQGLFQAGFGDFAAAQSGPTKADLTRERNVDFEPAPQ